VDDGQIRMLGETHAVVSAYESAMMAGEQSKGIRRSSAVRTRFLRWEIAKASPEQRHILSTVGPVRVNFVLELSEPVRRAEYGIALFNPERQLMWARGEQITSLAPGVHVFSHRFESLPLRPGPYQWQVSIWEGGVMLDLWDCIPDMVIATEVHQHYMDEWNGALNLPTQFQLTTLEGNFIERDSSIRPRTL
jgi:hypothetical protein